MRPASRGCGSGAACALLPTSPSPSVRSCSGCSRAGRRAPALPSTRSARRAIERLGARVREVGNDLEITGAPRPRLDDASRPLDLENSGTGARLLLGLLAGARVAATLTGDASLRARPMRRVVAPLA